MSKITSIIVCLCIVSLPFLYSISGDILANELISSLLVFLLLFVVGIQLIYTLFQRGEKIVYINIVDILVASFFFYCLFCILINREWETDKYLIYKWSAVILSYIFFRNCHCSIINLLIACCISGIFQSIIAICQDNGLIASRNLTFDVTGSFNNPGPLGGYIAICCTITIGLLYYVIKNKQNMILFFLSLALFIQLYGLNLTESRAAILSLVSGCLFVALNSILLKKITRKNKKRLFIIAGLAFIVGGWFIYQYKPASADGRLLIWRVSADMIADAPFFGYGVNGFSKEYMIYQANYFKETPASYFIPVADNVVYPFNEFIRIWIQYGGVGLLLVILLFYSIWVNSNKNEESDIMKAGLSALLIFSFFSYPFSVFPLLLFCPFLCGLMQYKIYCNFRITNLKRILMILMTVILMIRTSKDILFLESISCSLLTLYEKNGSDISHSDYEKIKGNTNFNDYYATWLIQQTETKNERLKEIYPSCEIYCLLGNYYIEHGDYKLAEYYFQEASFMVPTRIRPKYNLWELYKDIGQSEKAIEIANAILAMKLKIESTYTLRMKRRIKEYYKY